MLFVSKLLLAAAALSPFSVTNNVFDGPMVRPDGARLVWSDEFNGPTLDRSKWTYDTAHNKTGWFNKEQQYYSNGRPENIRLVGGLLVIEARREDLSKLPDWGGQKYSSAKIVSTGAGWTYGFYEIRARLPCARGTWPAIWMLPTKMKKWPDDGEIDIMEQVGSEPNAIHSSLHTKLFNHVLGTQLSAQRVLPTSCTAFHRYQLDWQPGSITIGADDRGIIRVLNDRPGGKGAWPFFTPEQMILNVAMGGDWAGAKGMDDAALPQRMEVDYVRVWQNP